MVEKEHKNKLDIALWHCSFPNSGEMCIFNLCFNLLHSIMCEVAKTFLKQKAEKGIWLKLNGFSETKVGIVYFFASIITEWSPNFDKVHPIKSFLYLIRMEVNL